MGGMNNANPPAPPQILGHITLRNLSFTYPTGGPEVLHNITLDIPAGSSLAIVGPTGSGKSTLVSLIPASTTPHPNPSSSTEPPSATTPSPTSAQT